ncbi:hypothetical protein KVR01_011641 [Diaporthe batatas]|uniref:uncharacterized protein n=1 Tax=Diaporthe batatas TaxID=748121 RepID=UPI001D043086|nr:uncharacterized protein KVR01_011641 [Diaporthe batatas]KAG8158519.1 hypothetical protein KVR01_011641 [Diaporthe batatas]
MQCSARYLFRCGWCTWAGRPDGGPHCTWASQPMYLHLASPLSSAWSRLPVLGNAGRQTNKVNNITFLLLFSLDPSGYGVGGRLAEASSWTGLDMLAGRPPVSQAGRQTDKQDSFLLYSALLCSAHLIPRHPSRYLSLVDALILLPSQPGAMYPEAKLMLRLPDR